MEKQKYERLPDIVHPKGTGIPGLTATLIKRDRKLCMYERSDEIWEVFFIQYFEAQILYGKSYPARETYPCNEDFGKTAWCFSKRENAERCYAQKLK